MGIAGLAGHGAESGTVILGSAGGEIGTWFMTQEVIDEHDTPGFRERRNDRRGTPPDGDRLGRRDQQAGAREHLGSDGDVA